MGRGRAWTWRCLVALLALAGAGATSGLLTAGPERAGASSTAGYWLVGTDGGVFAFGRAAFQGSTGDVALNEPIVGIAATPTAGGYWMTAADGGIFAFGDAAFLGSMAGQPLNKPIVAMTATPTGRGYWLVASDGGIFAFGDAAFFGSVHPDDLKKPVVDITATPSGRGYWLVASDGAVYAYGDARFYGAPAAGTLAKRIHAMAATPTGRGYWLVGGDGAIFAFGDAGFHGAATDSTEKRVIEIAPSASGAGYYVTTSNGQVLSFGDATNHGGLEDTKLNHRVAAMAAVNANQAPVARPDELTLDEDTPASIDVLANDVDAEDSHLTLERVGAASHGTADAAGGQISYRPAPDFNGSDTLTYVVADDRGETATGVVTISVRPVDDVPALVDDELSLSEDASIEVDLLANDTGVGDGLKSVTLVDRPENGTATLSADGFLTYAPKAGFAGDDTLRYRVVDADGDEGEGTVTMTVLPENDIPKAFDDGPFTVRGGRSVTMDVLRNDDQGDGDAQIRLVDPQTGTPGEAARVATDAGEFRRSGDGVAFSPVRGFIGTTEVRYAVVDEDGKGEVSNVATASVTVVNGPPGTEDQSITVKTGQTGNGRLRADDPEGDPVTFRVVGGSGPTRYRLALDARTGDFAFGPVSEPGKYVFDFIASDGTADSEPSTVTVHVEAPAEEAPAGEPAEDPGPRDEPVAEPAPRDKPATSTTTRPPSSRRAS